MVTDSSSDLPEIIRKELGISVVPLSIQFGDDIYRDGVDMSAKDFYTRLKGGNILPSTCQPSPADFEQLYRKIAEPGDSIVSIHLSSQMSGTYQSAVLARSLLPEYDITCIDTKSASIGVGLVAIAVAEKAQQGASKEECIQLAERIIEELDIFFVVDTLEYLQKNGRIGKAQAMVGGLLNIKPILTIRDGFVAPFEKVRGRAKAFKRIKEGLSEYCLKHNGPLRMGVSHADCLLDAEDLAAQFKAEFSIQDLIISDIGPTIGVHVGPGTIAVLFYPLG